MIADRVRLARRKSGLSLRGLSAASNGRVTARAIGKYERGESVPSSGVLVALSKALGVSLGFLMDAQDIEIQGVEFRTKTRATVRDRARVETEVLEWIERYLQIEAVLELDSSHWQCPVKQPREIARVSDAEQLAADAREEWRLGIDPIPNTTELLEEQGLKVLTVKLPDCVSGLTCLVRRPGGRADSPVVVANDQFTLERRRFTLARELARRLLETATMSDRDEEDAANRFASAFLMPREHLLREVGKHRNMVSYKELIELKHVYGVSGAALLVRLRQLNVISQSTLTYAYQTVARGWRTKEPEEIEPVDQRGQRERPTRFERLCYRALAEGLISLAKGAELLRTPLPQVEAGLQGPHYANAHHSQ